MPEVVVMVGWPGCGKTAWVKRHLAGTHVVVSKDFWPNTPRRDIRQQRAIADALRDGLDVVVDDSNLSPVERRPIIAIAREQQAGVRAVLIETDATGGARSRPVLDGAGARGGSARWRAAERWGGADLARRRLVAPTAAEGFDSVEIVAGSAAAVGTAAGAGGVTVEAAAGS